MAEDAQKRRELYKMKFVATSLLAGAFLIYVTALFFEDWYAWVGFVRATAEAAMVGAIADWFAVTALFRHPLGLKIPHTAIVPRRKREIGEKLASFVRQNFLTEEVIADKLRSMELTRRAVEWLGQPENSRLVADQLAAGAVAAIQVMKDEDVQALIEKQLVARIRSTQFAPLLGNLLSFLTAGNRQQELLMELVKFGSGFLKENKAVILEKINEELPWWAAVWGVDRRIYQTIIHSVDTTLAEVKADPKHPLYRNFEAAVSRLIEGLKTSSELQERETTLKEELLQQPVVQEFSASLWTDIKASLVDRSDNSPLEFSQPVQQMLLRFGEVLQNDPVLYGKIDHWLCEVVIYLTKTYGHEVESLISNTINKWNPEMITDKIETEVGRDLQFIRINGTLIGGLVGLLIYTVSFLVRLW
ncbi:MAG: DUF445 domain-containing protein [Anaerolineales bacterium]|nr:DUF445 domain-containing protein [Anaerolineales bacterium]